VGPTIGLDDLEKSKFLTLSVLEIQPLARPAAIPTELPRILALEHTFNTISLVLMSKKPIIVSTLVLCT
jgi:hypothetical protein